MTDVARRFRITYNGQQIGGTVSGTTSGETRLTRLWRLRADAESFELGCEFVISSDDGDADYATAVYTALAALRAPFGDLRLDLLNETSGAVSATPLDLRASQGGASNVTAEVEKPGDADLDGVHTSGWTLRVTGGLPADYGSRSGARQDFAYDLSWSSSRVLTAVFTGTWTDVPGGSGAKAQYDANVTAKVESVRSALGVQWELVGEELRHPNDQDDELEFRREYREVHYNQTAGTLDDARITDPSLELEVDTPGARGSDSDARPLKRITATWSASVPKDQTKDLTGLWLATVRPWIVQNVRDAVGDNVGVELARFSYDPYEQVMRARVEAVASGGSDVVERRVVTDEDWQSGAIIRYVWQGPAIPYVGGVGHVYQGNSIMRRTITTTTTFLGRRAPGASGGGRGGGQFGAFGIFSGPNAIANALAALSGALDRANDLAGDSAASRSIGQRYDTLQPRAGGSENSGDGGGGAPTDEALPILLTKRRTTGPGDEHGKPGESLPTTDVTSVEVVEFVTPVPVTGGGGDGDPGQARERGR